jgi:hypothetical protein
MAVPPPRAERLGTFFLNHAPNWLIPPDVRESDIWDQHFDGMQIDVFDGVPVALHNSLQPRSAAWLDHCWRSYPPWKLRNLQDKIAAYSPELRERQVTKEKKNWASEKWAGMSKGINRWIGVTERAGPPLAGVRPQTWIDVGIDVPGAGTHATDNAVPLWCKLNFDFLFVLGTILFCFYFRPLGVFRRRYPHLQPGDDAGQRHRGSLRKSNGLI